MSAPTTPGYEQARDELADVVRKLETGGTTLEESLALWERGQELAVICQTWLDNARERLAAVAPADDPAAASGEEDEGDDDGAPEGDG